MQRVVRQDREALGELYDAVSVPLFSLALRMLADHQEAEDVTHELFVQIWQKADRYDPDLGTPLQWAVRMLRNRCIDRLRARQRRNLVVAPPGSSETEVIEAVAAAPTAEDGMVGEEAARVRSAVAALPADQRQALEMAFFSGLSHHEIALELNQPLGTVKARIRRGMLKLRDTLEVYR